MSPSWETTWHLREAWEAAVADIDLHSMNGQFYETKYNDYLFSSMAIGSFESGDVVACSAPQNYQNQCCIIFNRSHWNKIQWTAQQNIILLNKLHLQISSAHVLQMTILKWYYLMNALHKGSM